MLLGLLGVGGSILVSMLKYKNVLKIPSSFRTASLSCFILKKSYTLNISLNFYFFHLFNGANVQGFTRLYHYL